MDEFTATEAAKWLGITREAVDAAAREGRLPVLGGDGPRRFSREAVEAYHQARVGEKVAALALARETPVSVARKVRKRLSTPEMGLPRPFSVRLEAMPQDWRRLFSKAELAAACVRDGEGCRWCEALKFAGVLGLRPVQYAEAYAELFGGPPCATCAPGLVRPYMAGLKAQVHSGRTSPSARAPRPSAEQARLAEEWAAQRATAPPAWPVQRDDDGRSLVSRRRREVQARLKAARRSGDAVYAETLTRQLQSLTADARVVDGRDAAPRGRKRCGTPVGVRCECHTSDRRGQR